MAKKLKWNLILMSLLYLALGIFLLMVPGTALNVVCCALGGVVLAFLLSGYRQRLPRAWRAMRWLLVLSQLLLLLWQPMLWLSGESPSSLTIGLLVADGYALWWLLTSRRLGACFRQTTF